MMNARKMQEKLNYECINVTKSSENMADRYSVAIVAITFGKDKT